MHKAKSHKLSESLNTPPEINNDEHLHATQESVETDKECASSPQTTPNVTRKNMKTLHRCDFLGCSYTNSKVIGLNMHKIKSHKPKSL